MAVETRGSRPRAYYPEYADEQAPYNGPPRTPGWDMGPERRIDDGRSLARGLAWFSIGLGLFELAAPGRIAEFLGVDERHENLIRAYGAREIAHGVAILSQRTPTAGVWSRIGGDALDMATLGMAFNRDNPRRDRTGIAMAMVAGVAVLDAICAKQLTGQKASGGAARSGGRWSS